MDGNLAMNSHFENMGEKDTRDAIDAMYEKNIPDSNITLTLEQVADLIDWVNKNNWIKYAGLDRWFPKRKFHPLTTREVFELFKKSNE